MRGMFALVVVVVVLEVVAVNEGDDLTEEL